MVRLLRCVVPGLKWADGVDGAAAEFPHAAMASAADTSRQSRPAADRRMAMVDIPPAGVLIPHGRARNVVANQGNPSTLSARGTARRVAVIEFRGRGKCGGAGNDQGGRAWDRKNGERDRQPLVTGRLELSL